MNIADYMNFFIIIEISCLTINVVKLIWLDYSNTSWYFLCLKTSIYVVNSMFWYNLVTSTLFVTRFNGFYRNVSHINTVATVSVLFAQFFVSVHLCCFRIYSIYNREFTVFHTFFKYIKKKTPCFIVQRLVYLWLSILIDTYTAIQHTHLIG